jgi:hypothetical protein
LKISDFDYTLPDEFIAQAPLQDRAALRLMVLDRRRGKIHSEYFEVSPEAAELINLLRFLESSQSYPPFSDCWPPTSSWRLTIDLFFSGFARGCP